ncbi:MULTISPECIES: hypothetical protein [Pseudomonas]|uniref:DUF4376 domain-containing protein n=1 Tax=Pseudomonas juntendi TaxID=2666183 RepID=A0ABD4YBY4_9PSED|nr:MULTISPECIES: hypothetical protein [Pseudomonas]EGB99532.1 hypothetical protein G1E_07643 [Pseudomonas sp. TJI-51]MBA6121626.1 hypothetical protein [Pseudomonas juntendi]MBR7521809.1 hypothetical protein [Pseudomonas juntendi]MCF3155425.1 hypothetical protein [Pseudomonas juntendi]MCI0911125.1 hypothetical protein [Pseudomonas putida]
MTDTSTTSTTSTSAAVYTSASSPVYANADKTAVTLTVTFASIGEAPFTATQDDTHDYGRELFTRAVAGDFGTVGDFVVSSDTTRMEFVLNRTDAVAAITVTTTAGNTFNGDEASQNRMARSIVALSDTDTITWVLANNSTIQATKAELQEALKLSGEAQTALWVQTSTTS